MKKSPTRFIRRVDNKFTSASLDLNFQNMEVMDSRVTFSRGSNATLFDSSGNLVYAKHNLLTYSEDFANPAWTKTNASITANTIVAPDGTLTGDKLVDNTTNGGHIVGGGGTVVNGTTYTGSVYLKRAEKRYAAILLTNTGFVATQSSIVIDLDTGAVTTGTGTPLNAFATSVGNGWYRCGFSLAATASAAGNLAIYILNGSTWNDRNYVGNGVDGIYIWGAQLNATPMEGGVTSSLSTYYPTVASAYYAPRFDHNPTTLQSLGLLIEEQRTNSIRNNTMQGAVAGTPGTLPTNWTVSAAGGLTTNVIGTGTAAGITWIDVQIVGTASSTLYQLSFDGNTAIAASATQAWTGSFWVAQTAGTTSNITSTNVRVAARDSGGSTLSVNDSAAITLSSSLTRYSSTFASLPANSAFVQESLRLAITNGAAIDITLRIGLPQLELGAFATSVIPTTTAAATRNADVASMTGTNFSSWYNATEGTVYVDAVVSPNLTNFPVLFSISDGTSANRLMPYLFTSGFYGNIVSGGVNQGDPSRLVSPVAGASYKVALGVAVNNAIIAANGSVGTADTSLLMPVGVNQARIGTNQAGAAVSNTHIRRIAYWGVRLDNSKLQALTT